MVVTGAIVPANPPATAVVFFAEQGNDPERPYIPGPIEVLEVPLIGWSVTGDSARPILGVSRYERRERVAVLITMPNGVVWDAVYNDNYPDLTAALIRMFWRRGLPKNRSVGSPAIAKALAAYDAEEAEMMAAARRKRAPRSRVRLVASSDDDATLH